MNDLTTQPLNEDDLHEHHIVDTALDYARADYALNEAALGLRHLSPGDTREHSLARLEAGRRLVTDLLTFRSHAVEVALTEGVPVDQVAAAAGLAADELVELCRIRLDWRRNDLELLPDRTEQCIASDARTRAALEAVIGEAVSR